MYYNTFATDKKVGKIGESLVKKILTNVHDMVVEDVSEIKMWQDMGVDLIGDDLLIEVKSDTSETPNIFFETVSNAKRGTKGCMLTTNADFIFYVHLGHDFIMSIPLVDYKEWVMGNEDSFREVSVRTSNAKGLLIPIKKLLDNVEGIGLFDFDGKRKDEDVIIERVKW